MPDSDRSEQSLSPPQGEAPLQGLRVLITRPQQQSADWQLRLQRAGAETLCIPMLHIEPLRDQAAIEAIKQAVMHVDTFQLAIFVSRNAVNYALDWLDNYWPQMPVGIEYFAVGKATAAALRARGLSVTEAGEAMNSESLLALPELQRVSGKKIVIFRGWGGRPFLGEQLAQRGAQVQYCELYRRQLPPEATAALAASDFGCRAFAGNIPAAGGPDAGVERDVISVHSGETLENLDTVIARTAGGDRNLRCLPLLLPGARVAALAETIGFEKTIVAENAADDAMLAALINWYRQLQ